MKDNRKPIVEIRYCLFRIPNLVKILITVLLKIFLRKGITIHHRILLGSIKTLNWVVAGGIKIHHEIVERVIKTLNCN